MGKLPGAAVGWRRDPWWDLEGRGARRRRRIRWVLRTVATGLVAVAIGIALAIGFVAVRVGAIPLPISV